MALVRVPPPEIARHIIIETSPSSVKTNYIKYILNYFLTFIPFLEIICIEIKE